MSPLVYLALTALIAVSNADMFMDAMAGCGYSVGCMALPPKCMMEKNGASCEALVTYDYRDEFNFMLLRRNVKSQGYVAVGFSHGAKPVMDMSAIVECSYNDKRAHEEMATVVTAFAYDVHNKNATRRAPFVEEIGIDMSSSKTKYVNGMLMCSFSTEGSFTPPKCPWDGDNQPLTFDLTVMPPTLMMIMAMGDVNTTTDTIIKHKDMKHLTMSKKAVNFMFFPKRPMCYQCEAVDEKEFDPKKCMEVQCDASDKKNALDHYCLVERRTGPKGRTRTVRGCANNATHNADSACTLEALKLGKEAHKACYTMSSGKHHKEECLCDGNLCNKMEPPMPNAAMTTSKSVLAFVAATILAFVLRA